MRSPRRPERRRRGAARLTSALLITALFTTAVGLAGPAPAWSLPGGDGEPPVPTLPRPEPDPEAVREEARRILAEGGFEGRGGEPARVPDGDSAGGGGTIDRPPPITPPAPVFAGLGPLGTVIVWLVAVVLAALAIWVLVRVLRSWRRRAHDDEVDDEVEDVVVVDDPEDDPTLRPSGEWRSLAEQAEDDGRWRDGLRLRYRALVAELIEQGLLSDVPGRTTGEHRREAVVVLAPAAADFSAASDLFDRAWYGNRPTGPAERDRFLVHAGRVLAVAGEAVPA